jgi:hypothetical protein
MHIQPQFAGQKKVKMVGEGLSKMLVNFLWNAQRHTPEDRLLTQMRCLFLQE